VTGERKPGANNFLNQHDHPDCLWVMLMKAIADPAVISTFLVDCLWIPLWKIRGVLSAVGPSSDCLFFGHLIGTQIPCVDAQRHCMKCQQGGNPLVAGEKGINSSRS